MTDSMFAQLASMAAAFFLYGARNFFDFKSQVIIIDTVETPSTFKVEVLATNKVEVVEQMRQYCACKDPNCYLLAAADRIRLHRGPQILVVAKRTPTVLFFLLDPPPSSSPQAN